MRSYYSEYVGHSLRFYARHPKPKYFRSEADRLNWVACDRTIKSIPNPDRDIVLNIYRSKDPLADNVYRMSQKYKISKDYIWKLVNEVEKNVAVKRGLINEQPLRPDPSGNKKS